MHRALRCGRGAGVAGAHGTILAARRFFRPVQPACHMSSLTLADFDFDLPPELIAQHPVAERSASRLLDGSGAQPADRVFRELPALLKRGDLLVFNDTRVIKARLFGRKAQRRCGRSCWSSASLPRSGGAGPPAREQVAAARQPCFAPWRDALRRRGAGARQARSSRCSTCASRPTRSRCSKPTATCRCRPTSRMPTTPKTRRATRACSRARPGAVAAPTASLHFDAALLAALRERGVATASVTLHVGAGTFQPVRVADIAAHRMHSEWFEVGAATVDAIEATRAAGGRIVAVGTTTVRSLESAARSGALQATVGETDIFITPGFEFRVVDLLADQLPPAAQHAADAGQRLRRARARDGAVPARRSSGATASSAMATRCCWSAGAQARASLDGAGPSPIDHGRLFDDSRSNGHFGLKVSAEGKAAEQPDPPARHWADENGRHKAVAQHAKLPLGGAEMAVNLKAADRYRANLTQQRGTRKFVTVRVAGQPFTRAADSKQGSHSRARLVSSRVVRYSRGTIESISMYSSRAW